MKITKAMIVAILKVLEKLLGLNNLKQFIFMNYHSKILEKQIII